MNVALIIAGGSGYRTGQDIPKQFISVYDKPIIIYTLEIFENLDVINEIEVVCLEGWIEITKAYVEQFGIKKLSRIVAGGSTVQESIRNGVFDLEGRLSNEDIVVIHDSVRPMVAGEVVCDAIRVAEKYGNAVSATKYNEQIFVKDSEDYETTSKYISRTNLRRVSTPQAYRFAELNSAYHEAFTNNVGIFGSSYTNTMMVDLGRTVHFSKGSTENIKLTGKEDISFFRAYIKSKKY